MKETAGEREATSEREGSCDWVENAELDREGLTEGDGALVAHTVPREEVHIDELAFDAARRGRALAGREREGRPEEELQEIATRGHCHRCHAFS